MPKRIQLRRTRGWRKPATALVVSRPSKWGNPYRIDDYRADYPAADERQLRAMAVSDFRGLLEGRWDGGYNPVPDYPRNAVSQLRGYDLACWCPLDQPCHADVLLDLANSHETGSLSHSRDTVITSGVKGASSCSGAPHPPEASR